MQPIIELKSELEGIIKLEIIKEDGTLKEAEGLNKPFYNLITDAGLDSVSGLAINEAAKYCRVGTSSTTPNVSDTALGTQTGSASPGWTQNSIQYTTQPYYSEHTTFYDFAVGAVSGNLTEIGFFSSEYGGTMWSRALIKDSEGNPTTLTLLATDQLKVTYKVRRYIPASLTGSFTLNTNGTNSTINYTITPANISYTEGPWYAGYCSNGGINMYVGEANTLGAITSVPAGNISSSISVAQSTYTQGSFQAIFSTIIPTASANFATGIGSMIFFTADSSYCGYQCSFSPKIMKTSSQTLAIGIRLSWGRTTQQ